jgi:DNA polymerase III subunit alpha
VIFDACAKFAEYGFNKSHSAPYALLTYQTAYLKANYPVEFLAASMTLDKSLTDKLAEFCNEARRLGIKVEPPSVNRSGVDFEVAADAGGALSIICALSAIKGVGEGQAEALIAARGAGFIDLGDIAGRVNPRDLNKRMLESLTAAGAFDALEGDRARVFAAIEPLLALAHRRDEERRAGQSALFDADRLDPLAGVKSESWPLAERLRREFDAVGFFLSGHPLDAYSAILGRLRVARWAEFARAVKQGASAGRLAAIVLDRQERRTRTGTKMGIVQLSDQSGQYEAILFQEGLNQYRDLLEKGAAVLVSLQANIDGEDVRVRVISVEPLDKAASRIQRGLRVFLRDEASLDVVAKRLSAKGEDEIFLVLPTRAGEVEIKLPGKYQASTQVAAALKAIPGIENVEHV